MKGINELSNLINIDGWEVDFLSNYGGSDRKEGVISPEGKKYMIKYSEKHQRLNNLDTSYVNNVVSEYVSSHIAKELGYDVHNTFLATKNNELVVACENFVPDDMKMIEFGILLRKVFDSGEIGRVPDLRQIYYIYDNDLLLREHKDEIMDAYFEEMILDALTGNFDRHMGNWGYIISKNGFERVAPIYDNGSTLFPALNENAMKELLDDKKELMKRVLLFPKIALSIDEYVKDKTKISYRDLFSSGYDQRLNECIVRCVPHIKNNIGKVYDWINNDEYLTDIRKQFYCKIIEMRYEYILLYSYDKCLHKDYNTEAKNRIEKKLSYTEKEFEEDFAKLMNIKLQASPQRKRKPNRPGR